jgi:hypothetical protein
MATRGILVAGLLGLFALAFGCASLPSSGPNTAKVVSQAASDTPLGGYVLVDVDGLNRVHNRRLHPQSSGLIAYSVVLVQQGFGR